MNDLKLGGTMKIERRSDFPARDDYGAYDMVVREYTTAGAPSTFSTTIGTPDSDFVLALAGHDAQHTWLAGSSSGTGGDWCQGQSDTTSFGYIVRFPLP